MLLAVGTRIKKASSLSSDSTASNTIRAPSSFLVNDFARDALAASLSMNTNKSQHLRTVAQSCRLIRHGRSSHSNTSRCLPTRSARRLPSTRGNSKPHAIGEYCPKTAPPQARTLGSLPSDPTHKLRLSTVVPLREAGKKNIEVFQPGLWSVRSSMQRAACQSAAQGLRRHRGRPQRRQ